MSDPQSDRSSPCSHRRLVCSLEKWCTESIVNLDRRVRLAPHCSCNYILRLCLLSHCALSGFGYRQSNSMARLVKQIMSNAEWRRKRLHYCTRKPLSFRRVGIPFPPAPYLYEDTKLSLALLELRCNGPLVVIKFN